MKEPVTAEAMPQKPNEKLQMIQLKSNHIEKSLKAFSKRPKEYLLKGLIIISHSEKKIKQLVTAGGMF